VIDAVSDNQQAEPATIKARHQRQSKQLAAETNREDHSSRYWPPPSIPIVAAVSSRLTRYIRVNSMRHTCDKRSAAQFLTVQV
jgi:hypothetical protein